MKNYAKWLTHIGGMYDEYNFKEVLVNRSPIATVGRAQTQSDWS
jgi:hypothetical protein